MSNEIESANGLVQGGSVDPLLKKISYDRFVTVDASLVTEKDLAAWRPRSVVKHTKLFYDWIDSINSGFQNRIQYPPFQIYCQQAEHWLKGNVTVDDFKDSEAKRDYQRNEYIRCNENSLYAANKYHFLQESSMKDGRRKYFATDAYEHHKIQLYLLDCGYSLIEGKPRQGGFTSVIGIWCINKAKGKKNHLIKFIAENGEKTEEIFRDKIKFPFSCIPGFLSPNVCNDSLGLLKFGLKEKKGDISGLNSAIQVCTPTVTAINGSSPDVSIVDEIGSIDILSEMLNEGRPALLWHNPETGELEMKRQVVLFGTGTMGRGGGAFEAEWNKTMKIFKSRGEYCSIIPIFFDWTVRCTQKEYDRIKEEYYSGSIDGGTVNADIGKTMFHQHYPSSPSDMFTSSEKLIVSRDYIDKTYTRIASVRDKMQLQYGYFQPVFDYSTVIENMDTMHPIIGAEWIPVSDGDERATTMILSFFHPDHSWVNRYYQGTDPIASDTGHSKMASVIWDEQAHAPCAIMNFREDNNPKYSFQQAMLMGLYYSTPESPVKELVEKNIGLAYISYVESHGHSRRQVINSEIPEYFQSGDGSNVGLDKKGNRAKLLINKLSELLNTYGENIFMPIIADQLKTFICKITRSGNETWECADVRYYNDDVLDALTYAYLCACSFNVYAPVSNMSEASKTKEEYVLKYDNNWNLIRVKERV